MAPARTAHRGGQRSFDDLGTPLHEVTFCVIDFETTGGSPSDCAITEIGAVKIRGGETLGTFQTLVNPGCAIPPTVVVLTGITDQLVARAPRIEAVLPSLLEFIGDAVLVGHNLRFDLAFLQAALERDGRAPLDNAGVDTLALARRLVRTEVPNCKLGTLAAHLRLEHRPSHRALDDSLATADLLHLLIDRASSLGVSGLDDLRSLPTLTNSPHATKLHLTNRLPRSPGVYLFRDGRGRVLYVGKATNLRSRVRQYFSTDERRKVGPLLAEAERIDHKRCPTELEAAVLELRLIHRLRPPYNRHGTRARAAVFVKLSLADEYPRFSIAARAHRDGAFYLGPLPSRGTARTVLDALHSVVPLRRCVGRPGVSPPSGPCAPARLGRALCPCNGPVDPEAYRSAVRLAVDGLTTTPALLVEPLWERMERLAAEDRFEEAADTRDRVVALIDAIERQRRFDQLRRAGRVVLRDATGAAIELRRGRLTRVREAPPDGGFDTERWRAVEALPADPGPCDLGPLPVDLADELLVISRWIDRNAGGQSLEHVEGTWASPSRWIDRRTTAARRVSRNGTRRR